MRKKRWIVAIDWADGDVEDTAEVCVYAESSAEAKSAASRKWRLTIGAEWPSCRVQRVFIVTDDLVKRLCY